MPFDFSLVGEPFRMQPGLRRIGAGVRQLTPVEPDRRHLLEKMAVLASAPGRALLQWPGFDAAAALQAVAAEASRDPPAAFTFASRSACAAPRLGWSLVDSVPRGHGDPAIGALLQRLPAAHRAAALLSLAFEEDFAVLDGATGRLPWLAVCLPSRWAPEDKLGLELAEVHAPVADGEMLRAATAGLVRLVTGDQRWERFVWTLTAEPRLAQHPANDHARWPVNGGAKVVAAAAFFRHERQTFIPIPGGGQAVFTIRVESEPLERVVADPDSAGRLAAALASMSPKVLTYRDLAAVRDRLVEWLIERSGSLP